MKFSSSTLRATSRNFEKALVGRGLKLSYQRSQDLWAQIVVGKHFSAACAQADALAFIKAGHVTAESICSLLRRSSRFVDEEAALEIFCEAMADDMAVVSYSLSMLLTMLQAVPSSSVISVSGDPVTGLGFMDSEHPGYVPVSSFNFAQDQDDEVAWIRDNSIFVVDVLNHLAGRSKKQWADIFLANTRASFAKRDEVFGKFLAQSVDVLSQAIGDEVISAFDIATLQPGDLLDFDELHGIVFDVFESTIRSTDTSWLNPDCDLAEAVVDHVTARIRNELSTLADGVLDESRQAPSDLVAFTASLAMRRFVERSH